MRERWHMPLAMWRVHYDLLGGKRRAGLVLLGYAVAVSAGLYMFRRVLPDTSLADFSAGFVNFLIAAQGLVLVAGGSNAIYRAMLRDFDLRMLESHRLTPMSNVSVILGYATGPTLQMLFIAALNLLLGVLFCILGKKPLIAWLGGNALMVVGAAVFWSFTVFIGLRKVKPLNPTVFMALVGMFGLPALPIPAIGSFLGLYPIICGFGIAREDFKLPIGLIAAVAGVSLIVIAFWFSVAAAKYRRPDLPALNGFRGLVLLTLWLLLGVSGIHILAGSQGTIPNPTDIDDPSGLQLVVMLIGGMLISWVPISGSVECGILIGRGGSPRNFGDRMRDLNVTLFSVILLIGIPALLAWSAWREFTLPENTVDGLRPMNRWVESSMLYGWLPIGLAVVFSAFSARGVFRLFYARSTMQRARALLMLIVLFAVPVVLDLARIGAGLDADDHEIGTFSAIIGFSPIGTVLAVMTSSTYVALLPGLAFQAVVALFFNGSGGRQWRRRLGDTAWSSEAVASHRPSLEAT